MKHVSLKTIATSGLAALALTLGALQPVAGAQPVEKCKICDTIFQEMDLIMACEYSIHKWDEGLVTDLRLMNPSLEKRLRELIARDRDLTQKYMHLGKEACDRDLCTSCREYFEFLRAGVTQSFIDTPMGAMTVTRAADPALLKKYHAWGDGMIEAVKQMSAMLEAGAIGGGEHAGHDAHCSAHDVHGAHEQGHSGQKQKALPQIPEAMLAELRKCEICRDFAEHPEIMFSIKPEVSILANGLVINHTVSDPAMLATYHELHDRLDDSVERMKAMTAAEAAKRLCSHCLKFDELSRDGAVIDGAKTATGSLTLISGNTPELRSKVHDFGLWVIKTMAEFEAMFGATEEQEHSGGR